MQSGSSCLQGNMQRAPKELGQRCVYIQEVLCTFSTNYRYGQKRWKQNCERCYKNRALKIYLYYENEVKWSIYRRSAVKELRYQIRQTRVESTMLQHWVRNLSTNQANTMVCPRHVSWLKRASNIVLVWRNCRFQETMKKPDRFLVMLWSTAISPTPCFYLQL